jgi:hypothetical protein
MKRLNFERANLLSRVYEEYRLYGPPEPEPKCPPSYGECPPKLYFSGDFESLRQAAERTGLDGVWSDAGNTKVYRTEEGGVMNWAPSTGTIWFQGKRPFLDDLHAAIAGELRRLELTSKRKSAANRERC